MVSFSKETIQLLYYTYFKPSALQARWNESLPKKDQDTSFRQLIFNVRRATGARRFLLQCLVWWLLGLVPLWYWSQGTIPWGGLVLISLGLVLAALGIGLLIGLPLSLAFPSMSGVIWALKPEMWTALQIKFYDQDIRRLIVIIIIAVTLVGGGMIWALFSQYNWQYDWLDTPMKGVSSIVVVALLIISLSIILDAGLLVSLVDYMAINLMIGMAIVAARKDKLVSIIASTAVAVLASVLAVIMMGVATATAISMGLVITVGVWMVLAALATTTLADGQKKIILVFLVASPITALIAIGVAAIVAAVGIGVATLPSILSLGFAAGLGFVLSPYRSFKLVLILAPILAVFFVASQGWSFSILGLLIFLISYYRLPLYPVALLAIATVIVWSRVNSGQVNKWGCRLLPPFTDEIVWLPLFGLDKVLIAAYEQDDEKGDQAINQVDRSFRQSWAAKNARLQLVARDMTRYQSTEQIVNTPQMLAQVIVQSEYEPVLLRTMSKVQSHIGEIAYQVEMALRATSEHVQQQRFFQALEQIKDFCRSLEMINGFTSQLFLPVARHWESLIGKHITPPAAGIEHKVILDNPYITDSPIQLAEEIMFAPRPDLIRDVEDALNSPHNKPVLALYGPRGMGKSTFLLHLFRLLPDEVVPIFISLRETIQEVWPGEMYYNWIKIAHSILQQRLQLNLPRPVRADFGIKPAIALHTWLDEAEQALGNRKILFTFDEFEWLADSIEKNSTLVESFRILQQLSDDRPSFYILFAGLWQIEGLTPGGRWQDCFSNIRRLEISYLGKQDAVRLLTEPIPDFPLSYEPGTMDKIINLTRSHPMLVQLVGSVLVRKFNNQIPRPHQDRWTVTSKDIDDAIPTIIEQGRLFFETLWEDVTEADQRVLEFITRSPNGLTNVTLMQETGFSLDDLREILIWLQRIQYIQYTEDRWFLQVELIRRAFIKVAQLDYED